MPTINELKQQEKEHLEHLIELGYLPDPEQLPDDVRLLFVAHAEKKPWPYTAKDLIEAWRETQEIVTKVKQFAHMEMASKQSGTNGQTDIVAELHHPAFEPEFNSIFGIDEQDRPSEQATQVIDKGPRGYNKDEKRKIVERYLDIQATITQENYARQHDIDDRTLRRWIRAYEKGKL